MAKPLATVDRVGLLPVEAAQRDYHLVVANVFLIGGEQKLLGRSGLRKEAQPYSLTVQLAYQDKATTGDRQPEHEAEPLDSRHTTRESQRETAKMTNEPAPSTSQAASKPLPTRESRRHRHGE